MQKKKSDRAIISLDISSDSIKMIKGTKKEDKICILDFACRKLPSGEATPDLVSRHLYEIFASVAEAKKARIHSNISGRKLCIRVVKLPIMPKEEISQAIRSTIRKYVSPDLEDIICSFSVLGETQEMGIKKLEVVFVAIQKSFFDEYLRFFKLIGVQPEVITPSCFSGWNLVRELELDKETTSLMLIDIESQETNLTAYREGKFVFTRNVSIGERDFTDKLKSQSQFSLNKPQDIKLLWGFEEQEPRLETAEQAQVMKIRKLLQDEAAILGKEIQLTLDHYYQITHGKTIEKCIILGDGSGIGGLVDFLKQKLEMPIESLHIPEDKLQFFTEKGEEFKRDLPIYNQALGTLIVGPDDINLIAQMKARAKKIMFPIKFPTLSKTTIRAIIVFICAALFIFIFLKGIKLYYQHQIKSYKLRQDRLQNQTFRLAQIKRKMDILDSGRSLYLRLVKKQPAYPVIIAEICKAIPHGKIILDELRFYSEQRAQDAPSPIKFTIVGKAFGKDTTGAGTTRFVLALEQSGYFENISVTIKEWALPPDMTPSRVAADRLGEVQSSEEERMAISFAISGSTKLKN